MTQQETFDIVAHHLLRQGKKSLMHGTCMYRGPNGLKCAAGILIPDSEYTPAFENKAVALVQAPVTSHLQPDLCKLMLREGHDPILVRRLQTVHDSTGPSVWEHSLRRLAVEYGLVFNPLPETNKSDLPQQQQEADCPILVSAV